MKLIKRFAKFSIKHPIAAQFISCLLIGLVIGTPLNIISIVQNMKIIKGDMELFMELLPGTIFMILVLAVFAYPFILTIYELISMVSRVFDHVGKCIIAVYDYFALLIGIILEYMLLELGYNVLFNKQWFEELHNSELHMPINTDYALTFAVIFHLFFAGMFILSATDTNERPPLVTLFCFAGMYIGVIEAVLFTIQIMGMNYTMEGGKEFYCYDAGLLFTLFIPVNMIIMTIRVMLVEIQAYKIDENRMSKVDSVPFLKKCNDIIRDSKNWTLLALIFMIPLLCVIIVILALFGQAPDAAIKSFTETANYTFSTKIPPQNIFYDEHYLCTVAAGGHEKIVKPLRMGKRHGHDVIVNRQLLIANAFEQIIEEKTPKFHRAVRHFYDTYGFPVAKLIKSKLVADIIWFIMKPLEWVFLAVIYFVDAHPEDRIASQYL